MFVLGEWKPQGFLKSIISTHLTRKPPEKTLKSGRRFQKQTWFPEPVHPRAPSEVNTFSKRGGLVGGGVMSHGGCYLVNTPLSSHKHKHNPGERLVFRSLRQLVKNEPRVNADTEMFTKDMPNIVSYLFYFSSSLPIAIDESSQGLHTALPT